MLQNDLHSDQSELFLFCEVNSTQKYTYIFINKLNEKKTIAVSSDRFWAFNPDRYSKQVLGQK